MKRYISWVILSGLIGTALLGVRAGRSRIVASVHAQEHEKQENRACSVATLEGSYGFYRTGSTSVGPLAAVGVVTFDGNGVASLRQTVRRNGITTQDLFTDPAISDAYEVDPDCTGRFVGPGSHFVIVDGGKELFGLSLVSGSSVYGVWKKIDGRSDRED